MNKLLVFLGLALSTVSCTKSMGDQPYLKTMAPSPYFADGRSAREAPAGSVSTHAEEVDSSPLDLALLQRGRERFEIFCSPCHGRTGEGDGMVVIRGYPKPTSLFVARLENEPIEYLAEAIRSGPGIMPSYADKVDAHDRRAIAAYIRVLQMSRNFQARDLNEEQKKRLEGAP